MRPIKFRGKARNGAWVYGYYEHQELVKTHIIRQEGYAFEVIPETVGQFTGMLDENREKIWEGDILSNGTNRYIVFWNAGCGMWSVKLTNGNYYNDLYLVSDKMYLVGTIHNNEANNE